MFKVIHYYLHMYLKTLGINALNLIYELDPAHFLSATELAWEVCLKKTEKEYVMQYIDLKNKYIDMQNQIINI